MQAHCIHTHICLHTHTFTYTQVCTCMHMGSTGHAFQHSSLPTSLEQNPSFLPRLPSPNKESVQSHHSTAFSASQATEAPSSPALKDECRPKGHHGGAMGLTPPATCLYHSQCGFKHLETCFTPFKVYLGNLAKPVGTVFHLTIFFKLVPSKKTKQNKTALSDG